MALTGELLKQNEVLKDLTEDQVKAIETLSATDENTVIGKKVREIHDQYDNDLISVLGEDYKKPNGVHSYAHLKETVYPLAKKAIGFEAKIKEYDTVVEELKEQLKGKSTDEALKQQLKDTQTTLEQLKRQHETDKKTWQEQLAEKDSSYMSLQIGNEFDKALTGIKFKDGIPESAVNAMINAAKSTLLNSNKPDFIDNGKGGKVLVFRNEQGEILNNPENQLNPFTPKELLTRELKDIIDSGRNQGGTGTGDHGRNNGSSILDLSGVKSQVEADEKIVDHLKKSGLTVTDPEFDSKHMELRKEIKDFDKLPFN